MRSERCERCPDEDTEACKDCELVKQDIEEKLKTIIEKEEQRIRGD